MPDNMQAKYGLKAVTDALINRQRLTGRTLPDPVFLGDGNGTLAVPNQSGTRMVYYYQDTPSGVRSVGTAVLWSDSNIPYQDTVPTGAAAIEVWLGYPPHEDRVHVMGQTPTGLQATGNLSLTELMITQAYTVATAGQVSASAKGGLYIHISPLWYDSAYYDGDALDPATGQSTLNDVDLTGYTPASVGFSNFVLVWLDPTGPVIGKAANTPAFTGGDARYLDISTLSFDAMPAGCIPLGAVGLNYGQTTIDATAIFVNAQFLLGAKQRGGEWIVDYAANVPTSIAMGVPRGIRVSNGSLTISGTVAIV